MVGQASTALVTHADPYELGCRAVEECAEALYGVGCLDGISREHTQKRGDTHDGDGGLGRADGRTWAGCFWDRRRGRCELRGGGVWDGGCGRVFENGRGMRRAVCGGEGGHHGMAVEGDAQRTAGGRGEREHEGDGQVWR